MLSLSLDSYWMDKEKKVFAFVPIDGYGHVNSLLALADALKSRGHRTVFICNDNDSTNIRHETIVLRKSTLLGKQSAEIDSNDVSALDKKWMAAVDALDLESDPPKQLSRNFAVLDYTIKGEIFDMDEQLQLALASTKPDVIVVDQLCTVPAIMSTGSPWKWVRNHSCNPLSLYFDRYPQLFPAPLLGVPVTSPRAQIEQSWSDFKHAISCCQETIVKLTQLSQSKEYKLINESPYLNLYMYPACLDYNDHLFQQSATCDTTTTATHLPNWHRCDSLIRAPSTTTTSNSQTTTAQIPNDFLKQKTEGNKLIYVSLGTTTSCNVPIMKRLISVLAKSCHRYIVALGPRYKQLLPLPDNMWGEKYVDQPKILPLIDLIITHGGNNTITESFYYGVPGLLVCPMFHDQLDNAARIEEKGFGIRINLFTCNELQLLGAIHRILYDKEIKLKCQLASKEIRENKRDSNMAATLLEQVAEGKILPQTDAQT